MSVARFGVSLEEELLEALDVYVRENNFPNRSRAIRHLIEKNLVEQKWQCNHVVAGSIVLLYDSGMRDVGERLLALQNTFHSFILGSQHFFLDTGSILEVISVKGPSYKLTEISDKMISVKGINHGKLVMSRVD